MDDDWLDNDGTSMPVKKLSGLPWNALMLIAGIIFCKVALYCLYQHAEGHGLDFSEL